MFKRYLQIFITFFKVSLFTFGGGFAMLPLLKHEIVENRNWISDDELTDIFTMAQLVPGLMYISSATFIGYRMAGMIGAVLATVAVLIPASVAIMILFLLFNNLLENVLVQKLFQGIIIGVTAMMTSVIYMMVKRSVKTYLAFTVLAVSFVLVEFIHVKAYLIIIFGILLGIMYSYMLNKNRGTNNA